MNVHVAALAYPIEAHPSFDAFCAKQARLVAEAAAGGAQLLVFPEYATVELTSVLPRDVQGELARELNALAPYWQPMRELYARLAREHGVYVVAPTAPEPTASGHVNRARLFGPDGRDGVQEKLQMTRFERESWGVSAGQGQKVFDTSLGKLAIAICYDVEFPLLVRRFVEAGADLVLVPSCTDTLAGYHRVSISCRARALENQCFVVQAPTVGSAPWSLALDENRGAAAVYGPVDRGFASDGVVVQGPMDVPGWVRAVLDVDALREVRRDGQVRNHRDWELPGHLSGNVTTVRV